MTKMIITDLDNTLLRSDKTISEYTIDILKKCQSKGVKVAFATARSEQASSRVLKQFVPDIFIGYGGALVSVGDTVIHRFDIPVDTSSQIIKECLNTAEVLSVSAINESIAFSSDRKYIEQKDSSYYQYSDFSSNLNYRYLKISLRATDPSAVEKIASHYPMCDMLRYTDEDLYRFANRDAVKWNAVKTVAEYFNINTESFVAFGDDYNDLEMLKKCGIGVAVKNAIDKVRFSAKYICETNDNDGVAKWIEEHAL
jgi:Cof subfamily protein (haloacid dehalogenase superfamily)